MGLSFRYIAGLSLLVLSGGASAFGLGELRNQPILGETLRLEIGLVEPGKRLPDASCFELVKPAATDLPWLRQGSLNVRRQGDLPVLEVRSTGPLRDPLLRVAVRVGCGYELSREYILAANPPSGRMAPAPAEHLVAVSPTVVSPSRRPVERKRLRHHVRPALVVSAAPASAALPRDPDQALSLRMIPELFLERGQAPDPERDILRLEFRMLASLNEQANSQLEAAEKLRNMEEAFGDLQRQVGAFAQRVEQGGGPTAALPAAPAATVAPEVPAATGSTGLSRWSLFGVVGGVLIGLLGWFAWQRFGIRRTEPESAFTELPEAPVMRAVQPKSAEPVPSPAVPEIELHELPASAALSFEAVRPDEPDVPPPAPVRDATGSLDATSLDEHFEASPVMELAEIMLTFGRVKGAAQALQEYIDHNPQDALQPWVRLMDVYRIAGMREEFEAVASNLNRNFNVEVQSWSGDQGGLTAEGSPRARSIEDIRHVMARVEELWPTGEADAYLHQLLRDNRGGQRLGFPLPVVEDILFLIDLAETLRRADTSD